LPDVGARDKQAAYMDRQPPAVDIVGLFAEQIEQLSVHHRDQKVEGAVRIGHDEEQCRFPVAQGIQLQLVIRSDFTEFRDIKGGQPGTAGNEDRLRRFTGGQLVKTVLPNRKVIWLPLAQLLKHLVYRVLEFFIILPDFHHVQKFQQRGKVLFFFRSLIVDIGNQRRKQEFFRLVPKRITAFAFASGV